MAGEPPNRPPMRATRRSSRRRAWIVGAGSTVTIAVVGALASALITPERIDAFFPQADPSPSVAVTVPATPALAFKSATSLDKAIAFDVPTNWAARDGTYNATNFAGTAVITGTQVSATIPFGEDGAYVGASAEFATLSQLDVATDAVIEEFLESAVKDIDWSLEGCVPHAADRLVKDGWFVGSRVWKDCASIPGSRLWEIAMIPEDRSSLVSIQIALTASAPDDITLRLIDSLVIIASKLPVTPTSP